METKYQCKSKKVCRFQINGTGIDYRTYCNVSEFDCDNLKKAR